MGMFDIFRRKAAPEAQSRPLASAGTLFNGLTDPDLLDYMRGAESASGAYVTASKSLQNMALLRCVTLISESIGMLPLNLIERGDDKKYAEDHPLFAILKRTPNNWQTAYEFKSLMQLHVLLHGNAYARVIRSRGQIIRLAPMDPRKVEPKQNDDWSVTYTYTRKDGHQVEFPASEIFHLRDLSEDGITGLSRVKLAREAIGIALQAERAAARLFKNGVMAGGALSSPNALSDKAWGKLQDSLDAKSGADEAHKWLILEEGLKAEKWANTAVDAQHLENRNHQIEEVARAFGVPRPLLMMDDTSWGSGIEQLGIFFVQYALQHWFTVWEQAIERTLLTPQERSTHYVKFNERALLRGTLADQADFFTKALGSGGHSPWMSPNEVRELQELSKSEDENADKLESPLMRKNTNEPPKTT
jgi:HK97 family phage portal protein